MLGFPGSGYGWRLPLPYDGDGYSNVHVSLLHLNHLKGPGSVAVFRGFMKALGPKLIKN